MTKTGSQDDKKGIKNIDREGYLPHSNPSGDDVG